MSSSTRLKTATRIMKDIERNLDFQWETVLAWIQGPGDPDLPWNDPDAFRRMFDAKYNELTEIYAKCGSGRPRGTPAMPFDVARKHVSEWAAQERALGIGTAGGEERWTRLTKTIYGNRYETYTVGAATRPL